MFQEIQKSQWETEADKRAENLSQEMKKLLELEKVSHERGKKEQAIDETMRRALDDVKKESREIALARRQEHILAQERAAMLDAAKAAMRDNADEFPGEFDASEITFQASFGFDFGTATVELKESFSGGKEKSADTEARKRRKLEGKELAAPTREGQEVQKRNELLEKEEKAKKEKRAARSGGAEAAVGRATGAGEERKREAKGVDRKEFDGCAEAKGIGRGPEASHSDGGEGRKRTE